MTDITGLTIRLCFAAFILYWAVSAAFTKRTARRDFRGNAVPPGLVTVLFILYGLGFSVLPPNVRLWTPGAVGNGVAIVLVISGLVLVLWARIVLGANWSGAVVLKEDHELVEHGPYQWMRHPIYTGLLLMGSSVVVWSGKADVLIVVAAACAYFLFKAGREEKLLVTALPSYAGYMRRTGAFVPRLWRR